MQSKQGGVPREVVQAQSVRPGRAAFQAVTLKLLTAGCLAGLLLMAERPAYAYVDPGSGLLTLQIVGASIAGSFFLLRQKVRRFFGNGVASRGADSGTIQPPKTDARP
jgi:hypothetical protein